MDIAQSIKDALGIKTDSPTGQPNIPTGAIALWDHAGVYGYTLAGKNYNIKGDLIGTTTAAQENSVTQTAANGELIAANAFGQNLRSDVIMGGDVALVDQSNIPMLILAEAMTKTENQRVRTPQGNQNIPLAMKSAVPNKGIFSSENFSSDTLPTFRMNMVRLLNYLITTVWPEYVTTPPIIFQFNSTGVLTSPTVDGEEGVRALLLGSGFNVPPLCYRVVASVVDTLIGNSQFQIFGSSNAYSRTYRFAKPTTSFVVFPRVAGEVDSYALGAGILQVFDGQDGFRYSVTGVDSISPAADDNFAPAAILALAGRNVTLEITPYIPTAAEANNLANLVVMGADGDLVAAALAALANFTR